jgi:hypothetical protein
MSHQQQLQLLRLVKPTLGAWRQKVLCSSRELSRGTLQMLFCGTTVGHQHLAQMHQLLRGESADIKAIWLLLCPSVPLATAADGC